MLSLFSYSVISSFVLFCIVSFSLIPFVVVLFLTSFSVSLSSTCFLDFSSSSPFSTLHEFSLKFGAKGYFLPTPFYVKNPIALKELWDGSLSEIRKVWRKCTVTVNGIGTIGSDSLFVRQNAVTCEQMDELIAKGAVGNLLGRWYDQNGNFIDCDLNREATSIPLEDFVNIGRRVLVSGEQDRVMAINAVLNKGIYNVFITIDSIAESLIGMKQE